MLELILLFLAAFTALCDASACHPNNPTPFGPNITQYAVWGLPNITYDLPPSWAGQIGIPGTQDDALFFWLFQAEAPTQRSNLIIWLDGGPGCTSLAGLTEENGPLAFYGDATKPAANEYSWTKLANVLYVDQPVGTGFSAGSMQPMDNAQVTTQFIAWLTALYGEFPELKKMETHLMGESWAGIFIPYFTQAIIESEDLFINLQSISMGGPTIGNFTLMTDVPTDKYIDAHDDILDVPTDVLSTFNNAASICGYSAAMDFLTYPPYGPLIESGNPVSEEDALSKRQSDTDCAQLATPSTAAQVNESIFSGCFGPCAISTTALNYFSTINPCFDFDNIAYTCATAPSPLPPTNYLNDPLVRAAIHAPDKTIVACNATVQAILTTENVLPPADALIPWILQQGVRVHIWTGEWDLLLPGLGTELVVQNMTWDGVQGLQRAPDRAFYISRDRTVAGYWGYERNFSYHRFLKAGHSVPHDQPAAAFAYVRDFVVGYTGYEKV